MNANATSPAKARFWVRPYEFEGDGSHGAAEDVASLEVGGKTRTFWLKTLENRLFFREVGRDENWNFGAREELSDAEKSDLPLALARVLASENYGRVVLLKEELCPCFGLAHPDGQVRCHVPNHSLNVIRRWKPTVFAGPEPKPESQQQNFLDWNLNDIGLDSPSQLFHEFRHFLKNIPTPIIEFQWIRGSHQEMNDILKSFIVHYWSELVANCPFTETVRCIGWNYTTAWQMREPQFYLTCYFDIQLHRGQYLWLGKTPEIQKFLDAIVEQFHLIGQGENPTDKKCCPYTAKEKISAPTHHEILEAHLFLRDWINQRLPPERARQWLDFS